MVEGQALRRFGCHCDLEEGQEPDDCVLDYGAPGDCVYARTPSGQVRRSKTTCKYWREVVPTHPDEAQTNPQALVEAKGRAAIERLANSPLGVSLAEWCEISADLMAMAEALSLARKQIAEKS